MRRTLLLIPHEIAGIPIFGIGWALGLMVVAAVAVTLYQVKEGQSASRYWSQNGLLWAIFAGIVAILLPSVELVNIRGEAIGLPIRGYGVMLLLGIVAAVGLALNRAKRYGIAEEVIYGIAPWAIIGGIVGARLFYVIEYRDSFFYGDFVSSLKRVINFTEGGLVVYGSFIGGFLAGGFHVVRKRLPVLRLGDVVVPTMFIGLALGRFGCLLNGCCYGGACDDGWYALRFPNGSPVFQDQLASGELVGVRLSPERDKIAEVRPGSLAEAKGIKPGDSVGQFGPVRSVELADPKRPAEDTPFGLIADVQGVEHYWSANDLPSSALPVRGTQVMSAIGGLSLCLALCFASRFVRRDGMIMLSGFIGYAILRFGMEMLRNDEPGQFGTTLTISQWVSIIVFIGSSITMAWLVSRPLGETTSGDSNNSDSIIKRPSAVR
ncbi:MAG TPA: diacylglyceryl transferase [Planctomycetaceae bacterium]|nr:diacylglyceryl transferase [Planctomycetaceae bacterium]